MLDGHESFTAIESKRILRKGRQMKKSHLGNVGRAVASCINSGQYEDCPFDVAAKYVKCRNQVCNDELQIQVATKQSRLVKIARDCWERQVIAAVCVFQRVNNPEENQAGNDDIELLQSLIEMIDESICDKSKFVDESGLSWELMTVNEAEDLEEFDSDLLSECEFVSERLYRFRCPFKKQKATENVTIQ